MDFHHCVPKNAGEPEGLLRRTRPWVEASAIVIASRFAFFVIALAGAALLNPSEFERPSFREMWARWDALHYIDIARHGYTGLDAGANQTAFFPFFPILIHAISSLGIDAVTAGLLITGAASLVAARYLYLLAREGTDEKSADNAGRLAVVYLVAFPTAVYLIAPYTEAVFLAGAIPAFYYARRSEWTKVMLPAALAVATRVSGVFLLVDLQSSSCGSVDSRDVPCFMPERLSPLRPFHYSLTQRTWASSRMTHSTSYTHRAKGGIAPSLRRSRR